MGGFYWEGIVAQPRLDHICMDQAQKFSPMRTSCYGDEDMVALMYLLVLVCVCVCAHMSLA